MIKKIVIATLAVILIGAVGVGAYDAYQGNSTLEMPNVAAMAAGGQAQMGQGGQGQGQMGQQGQGQMDQHSQQGQGGQGQHGQQGAQGQGANGGQPVERDWITLTGTVIETQQQGLLVDTEERGQLLLSLGRPGFADEQGVVFNPGDAVTINGFIGDEGFFVAGDITNNTTGDMLMLRDPNGRPLWAGPGREQNQNGQGGQGNGRNSGNGGQGQGKGNGGGGQGQGRGNGGGQSQTQ